MKKEQIVLLVILFLYIYDPPIIMMNLQKGLEIVLGVFLVISFIGNGRIRITSLVIKIGRVFFPFLAYYTFMFVIHCAFNTEYNRVYWEEYSLIIKFLIRIVIVYVFVQRYRDSFRISDRDYVSVLLSTGWIQVFFVFLSFVSPAFRANTLQAIVQRSEGTLARVTASDYVASFRSFGFVGNPYDAFGYVLALTGALGFIKGLIERKSIHIILSFALLFATLVNSRTGIFLLILSMVISIFLVGIRNVKQISALLKYIIFFIFIAGVALYFLTSLYPATMLWLQQGVGEIIQLLLSGEKTGTFVGIRGSASIPPDIVFGMGGIPNYFGAGSTDNGYLTCLWRFGIVGTILFLLPFVYIFIMSYIQARKSKDLFTSTYAVCAGVIFLLYLYKIFSLGNMGGNLLIFSILIPHTVRCTAGDRFQVVCNHDEFTAYDRLIQE